MRFLIIPLKKYRPFTISCDMISVNNKEFEWYQGMTMTEAVKLYQAENTNVTGHACVYLKNNTSVDNQDKEILADGDKISVFPLLSGG